MTMYIDGDCYFDIFSKHSIKYMGCTDDIGKIPSGFKPWNHDGSSRSTD